MSSVLFRAWSAAKRGEYAQAGQLYRSAGRLDAALEMFLRAGELRAAASVEEEQGKIFDAAKHLSQAGDRFGAADLLRKHRRFLQSANLYAELGQFSQAAALAEEAGRPLLAAQFLEQENKFFEAGEILRSHAEQIPKAMLYFEKALLGFPETDGMSDEAATPWLARKRVIAHVFEEGGASDRAADLFESLGDAEDAARCYEKAKMYDKALGLYRRLGHQEKVAELIDRVHDTPMELRAEAAAAQGDSSSSAQMYLEAGAPERAAPLLEETGRLTEAADAWREAGEWEQAGNLYYRSKRFHEAAECYRQAQLFALALSAYEGAGDLVEASRMAFEAGMWERAYELAPGDSERQALVKQLQAVPEGTSERNRARLLLGRAFMDLDQPDLALECVRGLPAECSGESPWLDYIHARCNEDLGMLQEAIGFYRKVLARDVEFQDARARLRAVESSSYAPPRGAHKERYVQGPEEERWGEGIWFSGEDTQLKSPVLMFRIPQGALAPALLRSLMDLRHPSILGLRDAEETRDHTTLMYEAFEGKPLPKAWQQAGGFKPFECIEQFRQILKALKEIHSKGFVHGRLEAGSVLVGAGGDIKIRGVGFGDLHGSSWEDYAAPEVIAGQKPTAQADLFSAGRILLGALTGAFSPLHNGREGSGGAADVALPSDFPPRGRALLTRLMAAEPQRRFSSADEALAELDALELPPGAIIGERYEILEELGRGGMGQVFKVRDLQLDEVVALKTLRGKAGMTDAAKARFLREIKLTRKITHPNVIRVFDLGQFRDLTFLTMEFIPGQTLSQWVKQGPGKAASLGEKVRVLTGIASGLAEAHNQGIVHRDLKPQNVILTPSGIPKLLDFGIAYIEEGAELTQDGHFVGSPKYVSPEQVQGKSPDARSDIYCFGLLCYFLLSGDDAFPGDNATMILLRQIREMPPPLSNFMRVPPSLEKLILRCLQKVPEGRPATIQEILTSLKAMA